MPAAAVDARAPITEAALLSEYPELARGPDVPAATDARNQDEPDSKNLMPYGYVGHFGAEGQSAVKGTVRFVDTVEGIRVEGWIKGLEPGAAYFFDADDRFHDIRDRRGACAAASPAIGRATPSLSWRFGPIVADRQGIGRLARLYPGMATFPPYRTSSVPVFRQEDPGVVIRGKEFFVAGRKLTVHKLLRGQGLTPANAALACAIIQGEHVGGYTRFDPLPGHATTGTFSLEQDEKNRAQMKLRLEDTPPGTYALVVHELGDCADRAGVGFGQPYQPESSTLVTHPLFPWPLHRGHMGTFVVGDSRGLEATKIFQHPLTSGGPASLAGRAMVLFALPIGQSADGPLLGTAVACGVLP